MPAYNDRDSRRDYGDRPIRSNSSVGSPRPGISRSSASRPASRSGGAQRSARPASRPQGQRSSGSRPPQRRRPAPRRRGVQPRFFILLAILIVVIVALILIFSGGNDGSVVPQATPTISPVNGGMSNATVSSMTPEPGDSNAAEPAPLEAPDAVDASSYVDEDEQDNAPKISSAEQVNVADLSINTSLPDNWMNVLLLGTDERSLSEPARTDTMIIASINTSTGQVKLTSLLRDTAVEFKDVGKYSGTYRLNAANYFGGPNYAMKIINEYFDMNIQYYASVNFYGFTRIAEALGGIDVDITEAEMNEIERKQKYQAIVAATMGIDEANIPNEHLTTYGANTHLNGRQTLAYARVRYVDNDITRAERQRTVIIKLTEKLRGRTAAEILALLTTLSGNVTTNMDLNTIGEIAMSVLSSGISNIETLRLPESNTYTIDRRNDQEMLYDVDWDRNKLQLYNFIYE